MTIYDLLLIILVLGTAAAALFAVGALLFRRWRFAGRLFAGLLALWIVYLGAGTLIAVLAPQRILPLGEDRCFDEMCFAVTGWKRVPASGLAGYGARTDRVFLVVDVRVSSHSSGRAQREAGRKGLVLDQAGHTYEVSPEGMRAFAPTGGSLPGLDAEVAPGQSVNTRLVFDVPEDTRNHAFTLGTNLAVFPPRIILANDEHFLHKPTIVPLD